MNRSLLLGLSLIAIVLLNGRGEIKYKGEKALAIGVELVEIEFDRDNDQVRFKPAKDPMRLREGLDVIPDRTFIGPSDGDAFLAIG